MLMEKINYPDGNPVKIEFISVKEYPLHTHNDLEIIYVLEGDIDLQLSYYTYHLSEKDIHIVNTKDIHGIYSKNKASLLLILYVNMDYFERYHPDLKKIIFFCGEYYNHHNYTKVKRITDGMIKIMLEYLNKKQGYIKRIEEITNATLFYIIEDFQYFTIQEKRFSSENKYRGDKFQTQRIHRIIDTIYEKYMDKLSLTQIAEQEHISKYYLSHLIKYATGYGFQDFLSFVRMEQSEELVIGTSKSIREIAYDCGFSSPQYYNKHFTKWFGITPAEYRKKYESETILKKDPVLLQVNEEKALAIIKGQTLNETTTIHLVKDLERESQTIEINLKAHKRITTQKALTSLNSVTLWDITQGLTSEYKEHILNFKKIIPLRYIRICRLFDDAYTNFLPYGWEWIRPFFDWTINQDIKPIVAIGCDFNREKLKGIADLIFNFLSFYIQRYGRNEIEKWMIELQTNKENPDSAFIIQTLKNTINPFSSKVICVEKNTRGYQKNPIFDTGYMPCYIYYSLINLKNKECFEPLTLMDDVRAYMQSGEIFNGGFGLITANGLRKPSYYALYLLSKLGDKVIGSGENYIMTLGQEKYNMLIYNYDIQLHHLFENVKPDSINDIKNKGLDMKKDIIVRLKNVNCEYYVKKYRMTPNHSVYKHWEDLEKPKSITSEDYEIIQNISFPTVEFKCIKPSHCYDIKISLEPFDTVLLSLDPIYK